MLKKLNQREIQEFTKKFEIKCSSVTVEKIKNNYFIIIDESVRFQINNLDLLTDFT